MLLSTYKTMKEKQQILLHKNDIINKYVTFYAAKIIFHHHYQTAAQPWIFQKNSYYASSTLRRYSFIALAYIT
jgi:hypothetical protein